MTTGRIVQINTSPGGVPKLPVETARVTRLGIEGDSQRDTELLVRPTSARFRQVLRGGDERWRRHIET